MNRRSGALLFLSPAVAILLLFTLFPFAFTLALSFARVSLVGGLSLRFGGLANWSRLVHDDRFWNALENTVVIVVVGVAAEFVLGLSLALLVNRPLRGGNVFRTLFILPMALAPIAIGYIWRMIYHETIGPLNALLALVGLSPIPWLSDGDVALASIILTDVWHWTPFMFIVLLAALQSLPLEVLEAAQIDGTTGWQLFRYIVFPMLLPTALTAIILRVLEAFKIVDEIFIITGGGPGVSTESLTLHAYYVGFLSFDLAYGATIALGLFLLVLAVALLALRVVRPYMGVET
ncbi:MAG: sugar ABC transporter permease [Armatimonadota bacterium]|nr:sugar ABC transporter permease [Armatimonadota bacterium]MDR7520606.1 sugar ABC transporter permease [Armatimonadota bacterium]MDR7551211.1 sugar ABC transporter permease [Armatimonadota bacterium]